MLIVSSAVIPNSFFLLQKTDVVSLGMHVLPPGAGIDEKDNFLDLFFIICLNLYMSLFCLPVTTNWVFSRFSQPECICAFREWILVVLKKSTSPSGLNTETHYLQPKFSS